VAALSVDGWQLNECRGAVSETGAQYRHILWSSNILSIAGNNDPTDEGGSGVMHNNDD